MSPSPHITPEGARRLEDELRHLWKEKRPEVTRKVAEAAAMGDRSENAEYIYGKKQLREIDRRIRYLSRRLDAMVVVDRRPKDTSRVYFGAWVTLEDEDGAALTWRIVGGDEIDPGRGWISIDAPAARALLGRRADEEVEIRGPEGSRSYLILEVSYDPPG